MNVNDLGTNKVKIELAGETVEVNGSDSVKETLKRLLQEKGIDSFTILVDGQEIDSTADLPERFIGHEIEVRRYVKPGC
jgi:hypothetical protein